MMSNNKSKFFGDKFLLKNDTAYELFANYAEKQPIFDYHCHLNPKEIYENGNYSDLADAWLSGDHYKWRLMRACGIDEKYITGFSVGAERIKKYATALAYSPNNPLYHWAHLELQRFFGIYEPLTIKSAEKIYETASELLRKEDFTVRRLIEKSNVKTLFTTDDPIDSLEYHKKLNSDFSVGVFPAFRPDKVLAIDKNGFEDYICKLSNAANTDINDFKSLCEALENRIGFFASHGCKAADHGMTVLPYQESSESELNSIFSKAMKLEPINLLDAQKFQTALMLFLAKQYVKRGWIMELHYGILRNTNTVHFNSYGADSGIDSVGDDACGLSLASLLNAMNTRGVLPKTVVFNGNKMFNSSVCSIIGSFNDASSDISKMQFGAAWWYNDTREGIIGQMTTLSNIGALGKFIGMLTDSRSFLSYPRHEYFRRILCNMLGEWIENGEYAADEEHIGEMIEGICYNNAERYFN